MRPRGVPVRRVLFLLLVPKHRTEGSSEDCRFREPGPQTAKEGSSENSNPHSSTHRICRNTRHFHQQVDKWDCWGMYEKHTYLNFVVHRDITSRYFFTQSKKTTLDLSSSSCDFSLDSISLLSEPSRYTLRYIGQASNFQTFAVIKSAYLCFFSLVE